MRIGIIGSRQINDDVTVVGCLEDTIRPIEEDCVPITFIGGGSKGSERIAIDWVISNDYDYVLFKPYNMVDTTVEHHPKFFFFRNKQIIDNADAVIVFLSEEENGVKRSIDYLKARTSKPYVVFGAEGSIVEERGVFHEDRFNALRNAFPADEGVIFGDDTDED